MNEAIIIWLYLSLGNLFGGGLLISIGCVTVMALLVLGLYQSEKLSDEPDAIFYIKKYYPLKTVIFICVLTIFYPSKDDLKYIIGGAIVWNTIESAKDIEGIDKLPENLVNAANHFLETTQDINKE